MKKKIKSPSELFADWWIKKGEKMVAKIEKQYLKENPDYNPDDEAYGDGDYVHMMMHQGDANNMTYDIAEKVFISGHNQEKWEPNQSDSLYCELDQVISEAYKEGTKCQNSTQLAQKDTHSNMKTKKNNSKKAK